MKVTITTEGLTDEPVTTQMMVSTLANWNRYSLRAALVEVIGEHLKECFPE